MSKKTTPDRSPGSRDQREVLISLLKNLPGKWKLKGDQLKFRVTTSNVSQTLELLNAVSKIARSINGPGDLRIYASNKLNISISSEGFGRMQPEDLDRIRKAVT